MLLNECKEPYILNEFIARDEIVTELKCIGLCYRARVIQCICFD